MAMGLLPDTNMKGVIPGRMTVKIPEDQSEDEGELVVFLIEARFNHSFGRFGPEVLNGAAAYFEELWKAAERDREKWGYYGRTSDMFASDDDSNNAIVTLSYWRSRKLLGEFARSTAHVEARQWFERTSKKHKHLSFMHEIYTVPRSQCETVLRNSKPFGLAQCQFPIHSESLDGTRYSHGIVPFDGARKLKMDAGLNRSL